MKSFVCVFACVASIHKYNSCANISVNSFLVAKMCSTSFSGGNNVGGLQPVSNTVYIL
jgi:hypothetical protein